MGWNEWFLYGQRYTQHLEVLLDVYEIKDKRSTIFWIKQIEAKNSEAINKKMDRKRKASQNKAKGPGINSANLKR
jgi:hypothetical protein